jgi:hypothetical protein
VEARLPLIPAEQRAEGSVSRVGRHDIGIQSYRRNQIVDVHGMRQPIGGLDLELCDPLKGAGRTR